MSYTPHTGPTRPRAQAPITGVQTGPMGSAAVEARLREEAVARLGESIPGSWRLQRLIAVGGTSVIFSARGANDEPVVVKLMRPEVSAHSSERRRFQHEAEIVRAIGHSALVSVHDEGVTARGEPFLVLEQLVGETLESYWRRHEQGVGFQPVLRLMAPVLQALLACHEAGVTYLNLAPSNIFLVKGGAVKLLDFGLARRDDLVSPVSPARANAGYMAPEQALELDGYGPATDIFGVGATMFALLSGHPVHRGEDHTSRRISAATTPPVPLLSVAPLLPREVAELVDHALAFSPKERFQNTRQMGQTLVAMLERLDELEVESRHLTSSSLAGELPPGLDLATASFDVLRDRYNGQVGLYGHLQRLLDATTGGGLRGEGSEGLLTACNEAFRFALGKAPGGLTLEVQPGYFGLVTTPLWRPTGSLDSLPGRLFRAGVRGFVVSPNVGADELTRFYRFFHEVALDDPDRVTAAARFAQLEFQAITIRMCMPLATLPALGEASDAVRTMSRVLVDDSERFFSADAASERALVSVEDSKVDQIRAHLYGEPASLLSLLPHILAEADQLARAADERDGVASEARPLLAEWLAEGDVASVLTFWSVLDAKVDAAALEPLARSTFDESGVAALLDFLRSPRPLGAAPQVRAGLESVLTVLGEGHVDRVVSALSSIADPEACGLLLGYALGHIEGREGSLGPLLADASAPIAGMILDALSEHEGASTLAALRAATSHSDPEVWERALRMRLERGGGEPIRDLKQLLEESDADVRTRCLELVRTYRVEGMVEALTERIHDSAASELEDAERRALLETLTTLSPPDAEAACVELLKRRGLVASKHRDAARLLAAEFLTELGSGPGAIEALDYAMKARWWNGRELQEAAASARATVEARLQGGGP